MTYTFKLARRLAVSRSFGMLPALMLFAACSGGDAIAPDGSPADLPESGIYDWRPRESTPVAVRVNPSSVILETNQLVRFRANGSNRAGDTVAASVVWTTTGGTILPDGRFSAPTVGAYQVIGSTRRPQGEDPVVDTSIVTVVRRRLIASLAIIPGNVTLTPGVSQTFSALGRLKDRTRVQIGTLWSATGGMIDAGGTYVAGDTAGTYWVIATSTNGRFADTAAVTISAPPSPPPPTDSIPAPPTIPVGPPGTPAPPITPGPPPPAPEPPPPASTLASVTLLPASATLARSTTRQFTAYGRTTAGDSVAVSVAFKATGGTVTAGGLYTAGTTGGTYRIVATVGSLADSATVTVTQPLGSGSGVGVPFGPFGLVSAGVAPGAFTLNTGSVNAANIVSQITTARANGMRLLLAMTGGAHSNYLSIINGVLQFDRQKWNAKMDTYNTPAIKAAVAAAVSDGTILGVYVMDEPNVYGLGDGNTWGPKGTMTKARVDSLCGYVKDLFPTLPVGVAHGHDSFEPDQSYRSCEFLLDQYSWRKGDVNQFRDEALALGRRDGMKIVFSVNILGGGIRDNVNDGVWDCPVPATGGRGVYAPLCRMTAQQVRDWGITLGSAGCALTMWKYDAAFMARADNQQAFRDVSARLSALPGRLCSR